MPSSVFQGWAPPGFWGPWTTIGESLYAGQFHMELILKASRMRLQLLMLK
jgi:hypothetical protein